MYLIKGFAETHPMKRVPLAAFFSVLVSKRALAAFNGKGLAINDVTCIVTFKDSDIILLKECLLHFPLFPGSVVLLLLYSNAFELDQMTWWTHRHRDHHHPGFSIE